MISDGTIPAFCARCKGHLRVAMDTDRDGALIEIVDPCRTCSPSALMRRKQKGDRAHRVVACDVCGDPLTYSGRGRPRKRHSWCRDKPKGAGKWVVS